MTLSRSMGSAFDPVAGLGVNPVDTRMDLAAMLAQTNAGSLAVRQGVFPGCVPTLVAGTAGWAYVLHSADFATSRAVSDGAHVFANNGDLIAATDPAPGTPGASRWDVLWVKHPSAGENAEASSTPEYGVTKGGASTGTPLVPVIPAGAYELGRNLMTSAATSTLSAGNTLTQTWRYTALRGCPILVRNQAERDELNPLAAANNPVTVERLDTGQLERNTGSGWVPITGGWVPWAPVLTASGGGLSLGSTGTITGRMRVVDMSVEWKALVAPGGSGIAAGAGVYRMTLPFAAKAAFDIVGSGWILGAAGFINFAMDASPTLGRMVGGGVDIGATQGLTAGGQFISVAGVYERA